MSSDFDKYQQDGAYHWRLTDSSWRNGAYNPPTEARFRMLGNYIPDSAQNVLDVGCGDGYLLHRLREWLPAATLQGLDSDARGVELARRQLESHEVSAAVRQGSAYDLPFDDASFDLVVMTEVIEHLAEAEQAVREAHRVLGADGQLLVTTPQAQPDLTWDPAHHVHEYSASELKEILSATFPQVELAAYWPMNWMRWWRSGATARQIIRAYSRLAGNPFLRGKTPPSPEYGQLMARCVKA